MKLDLDIRFLKLDLDILNFENQCLTINRILSKNGLFLRVFELKDKFHFVTKQAPEKKNNQRTFGLYYREI